MTDPLGMELGPSQMLPVPLQIVYDRELIPGQVQISPRPHWQLDALLAMTVVRPQHLVLVTGA